MAIDGKLIGLRVGTDFVPCEVNVALTFEVDKLNTSSSVNGAWEHHRNGYKRWNVTVDGRLLVNSLQGSFNSLFDAYLNDTPLAIAIENRDANGQPIRIWGEATIQQGSLEAASTGKANWQMQFKGNGALNSDIALFFEVVNAMPYNDDKDNVFYIS